ncbi:MAG: hypothetical protein JNM43_18660 [Planctomycetaceae bacterium]|nr:hypothetical protein [Planctomycetaceae bacterium]
MRSSSLLLLVMTLLVPVGLAGCGKNDTGETAAADDDFMSELMGPKAEPTAEPAEPIDEELAEKDSVKEDESADARLASAPNDPKGVRLELHLKEGDRFPLIKTIEQTLIQKSDTAPASARTRLELTLAISVEQEREDAILLRVNYGRVNYEHDINGQRLSFDSQTHQGAVPWDAIPYAGMVGNGFSFWLGRNNRIRELVGYKQFLERCVANVPLERRETLLAELSNRFGDDGVANFVDDSIGLLPYDATVDQENASRVMVGDEWIQDRRMMLPVPVHTKTTYRLLDINDRTAEVDITGRVDASEAVQATGPGRVRVSGGRSTGNCTVDRATGLPLEMRLNRELTIHVTTEDNHEVVQEKEILTTIRAFPEVRGPVVRQAPAVRNIAPASGSVTPDSRFATPIPTNDESSTAVRAVYPQ